MRLGDLDELKKHISELMLVYSGTELDNAILNAIDNAPTVEITEEQVIDKLHETDWLPLHDKEMTERPQDNLIQRKLEGCRRGSCKDCKDKDTCNFSYRRYPGWDKVENMRGDKE